MEKAGASRSQSGVLTASLEDEERTGGGEKMPKFMCYHSMPAGTVTAEQLRKVAQAAQNDPQIRGHHSFANLSEGKLMCVMEAPDEETLASWFKKMQLPFDSILRMELEGEGGEIKAA
jgi:hypothetical protein